MRTNADVILHGTDAERQALLDELDGIITIYSKILTTGIITWLFLFEDYKSPKFIPSYYSSTLNERNRGYYE